MMTQESGALITVGGDRTSAVSAATQGHGIVGLTPAGTVQKNPRDPLVELANNQPGDLSTTVSLVNPGDGTLYDPNGGSGSTVRFTLLEGNTERVERRASVSGTLPYPVSVGSDEFDLDRSNSVEAVTGNKPGAVDIRSPSQDQNFEASPNDDLFDSKAIDVRDNDLDRLEITELRPPGGGSTPLRRSHRSTATAMPRVGDPDYDVTQEKTYDLNFKAYDADGNSASVSLDDDA